MRTGEDPSEGRIERDGASAASTGAYRAARDQLLHLRGQHRRAVETFAFPDVGRRFNWAHDWFDVIGRGNDRQALVIVEEDGTRASATFDEMAQRSDRLAAWLRRAGMRRGDPVIIMLGNQMALWESMLAVMKLGAVIVPTTAALGAAELEDRVTRSRARFVLCNAVDTPKFASVPADVVRISVGAADGWLNSAGADGEPAGQVEHPGTGPGDPLLLYFTSGTTSRPKLVEHTQVSYPVGHLTTMYWLGVEPGDVHCNISSPGWAKHAWSCFFAPWAAEATVFVYNYRHFDPAALLDQLRSERVTTFCAPPTVWRMLVTSDLSGGPGTLREVVAAGEPLNPEVISQVQRHWGLTIRDGYGQTETTASVANTPGSPVTPGSMGRPLPGVPVVLVDVATGARVEGAGEGEICIDLARRPVSLMAGYRGDEHLHHEAMAGGFYHTGDVATVDETGSITFVGRTDDVFKSSDYKVSPFEVESVLIEHPAVAEAAVVPAPDDVRLAVPKAYVTLVPGVKPDRTTALDILGYARHRLAPFQRVRRLEFSDELPKTISGKIRRVELRAREERLYRDRARAGVEWRDDELRDVRPS